MRVCVRVCVCIRVRVSYVYVSACLLVCAFVRECWGGMLEGDNYVHMCVYTYIDVLMFRRILEQTHTYVCGDVLVCADVCRRM